MSETKFVRYGDKTMALEPGMTLDAAKEIMARHFPELADPKVDTKKDGDKTTYVFSKQAGRKGNGQMNALVAEIGQHCIAQAIVEPDLVQMVQDGTVADAYESRFCNVLREQAANVRATANALLDAPAQIALNGSVL